MHAENDAQDAPQDAPQETGQDTAQEAPKEAACKRIFLAPGRAMVTVHNVMSRKGQVLQKGRWSYNVAAWICASIIWLVVVLIVVMVVVAVIVSAGK